MDTGEGHNISRLAFTNWLRFLVRVGLGVLPGGPKTTTVKTAGGSRVTAPILHWVEPHFGRSAPDLLAGFGMEAITADARRVGVKCHGTVEDLDALILEADVCSRH